MSEDTDVEMFMLRRWAIMALELPSRSVETVKAESWITSASFFGAAASELVRLISRTAVWPAVTANDSCTLV